MSEKKTRKHDPYQDIQLPQSLMDEFARFLVPEIRNFYESEEGKREFAEWQDRQEELDSEKHVF